MFAGKAFSSVGETLAFTADHVVAGKAPSSMDDILAFVEWKAETVERDVVVKAWDKSCLKSGLDGLDLVAAVSIA